MTRQWPPWQLVLLPSHDASAACWPRLRGGRPAAAAPPCSPRTRLLAVWCCLLWLAVVARSSGSPASALTRLRKETQLPDWQTRRAQPRSGGGTGAWLLRERRAEAALAVAAGAAAAAAAACAAAAVLGTTRQASRAAAGCRLQGQCVRQQQHSVRRGEPMAATGGSGVGGCEGGFGRGRVERGGRGGAVDGALPSQALPPQALHSEALPSRAQPSGEALPSLSLPSEALPPRAQPSEVLPARTLPSEALSSEALPSEALPSEALPSKALPSEALPSRPAGHKRREPEGAGAGLPLPLPGGKERESAAVGRPFQRPRVTVKSGAVTVPKKAAQVDALCTVCGVRDDSSELLSCWTCRKSLCEGCKVKCQAAASCKHVSCPGCIRNPRCGRTDIVCCEDCQCVECADCNRCAYFSRCADYY